MFCRFLDPIIHGDYPPEMRQALGSKLPTFSIKERRKLQYKLDFIGINHYTSLYVRDCTFSPCKSSRNIGESFIYTERNGIPIGKPVSFTRNISDYIHVMLYHIYRWSRRVAYCSITFHRPQCQITMLFLTASKRWFCTPWEDTITPPCSSLKTVRMISIIVITWSHTWLSFMITVFLTS